MNNEQLTYIYSNGKLLKFCQKVMNLNNILKNVESRLMFLESLVSADTLIDKHDYKEHIATCNFIKNNIKLMQFDDINDEGKILNLINDTLNVLKEKFEIKYLK